MDNGSFGPPATAGLPAAGWRLAAMQVEVGLLRLRHVLRFKANFDPTQPGTSTVRPTWCGSRGGGTDAQFMV